jgi:hypothetical protein
VEFGVFVVSRQAGGIHYPAHLAAVRVAQESYFPSSDRRFREARSPGRDSEQRDEVSMSAPPIREPWKTDKTGKLVSMPWILWLQQLASAGQLDGTFSEALFLQSTAGVSSNVGTPATSDDIAALEGMMYTPSSSSVPSNDPEMLIWMSF